MSTLVLFAPDDGSPSLACTRWMADRHAERLASEGHRLTAVLDAAATRRGLEDALADAEVAGLVLLSHGREGSYHHRADDAVVGSDGGAALDRENAVVLSNRWAHAIACRVGVELAGVAVASGASCFAAYDTSIIVDWDPVRLSCLGRVAERFARCTTETSSLLAAGARDHGELRRALSRFVDDLVIEAEDATDPETAESVKITANQLIDRLVLRVRGAA